MISITEQIDIDADPDEVWKLLRDPEQVVACVPGAELIGEKSPGTYDASIAVKFGPTLAKFRGEATVGYEDESRICTVSGRGNDARGRSPITGKGQITVTGDMRAQLKVDGAFDVSGPLEPFISTGGTVVARSLLEQFAANLSDMIAEKSQVSAPVAEAATAGAAPEGWAAAPAPRKAAKPVSGGKLLYAAIGATIRNYFRKLIGKADKNG